ncbi:unnamed protein product, partial [Vitis vinifera]
MMIHDNTRKKK